MILSIVIPVFNEEKSIERVLADLGRYRIPMEYEIIIVDDSSEDSTRDVVLDECKKNRKIRLVRRNGKRGLGRALKKGFEVARGDIIVTFSGDSSDDAKDIALMLKKICEEGYDFVCASRYIEGGSGRQNNTLKGFFSKLLGKAIHLFVKVPTLDSTNTYKMFRKEVLKKSGPFESNRYTLGLELLLKAYRRGFKITEIPTLWRNRREGKSHFIITLDGLQYISWFIFALIGRHRQRTDELC